MQPHLRFALLSALVVVGAASIFSSETARALEAGSDIETHLYALEKTLVRLGKSDGSGGAAESIGNDLLVVTAKGRFSLVRPDGDVENLDGRVPMNVSGWESTESFKEKERQHFRVADILLKELSPSRFELFVTHHYFTGECVRFRLSSTTIESPPPPPLGAAGAATRRKQLPCCRHGERYSTRSHA